MSKVFIGIDPGNKGGISIIDGNKTPLVYNLPVVITKAHGKVKQKTRYDITAIASILKPYSDNGLCFLERVSVRPGEGGVSGFNFGVGFGILQGIAITLGFELSIISPQTWKAEFPALDTDEIKKTRAELAAIKIDNKTQKDKAIKKLNKKNGESLERKIKTLAKDEARFLASKLYPKIADRFERKLDDGVAESLLIAVYGKKIK
jgi:hypothetical protein